MAMVFFTSMVFFDQTLWTAPFPVSFRFLLPQKVTNHGFFVSNFEALKSRLCQKEPFMKVWSAESEEVSIINVIVSLH